MKLVEITHSREKTQQGARANAGSCHASCWRTSRASSRRGSSLTLAKVSKPLSAPLVAVFSACFLAGVFGTLLAPQPLNFVAAIFGLISFSLFIPIGRRIDEQKAQPKTTPKRWRIVVNASMFLLALMGSLTVWLVYMFVHYRRIDVGLTIEWCFGLAVMLVLRSVALKRLRASESEEKG